MTSVIGSKSAENSIKNGEIILCSFAVEHNISFNAITHMTKLLPKICTDSKIAQDMKCARIKAEAVMKNII